MVRIVSFKQFQLWLADAGDVTGAVRLWGAKGEHAQKNEYRLWETRMLSFMKMSCFWFLSCADRLSPLNNITLLLDVFSKTPLIWKTDRGFL